MFLSTYRSRLLSWLEDNLSIDSYLLDVPEFPGESYGHVAPLRDIQYQLVDAGLVQVTASQDLFLIRAYAGSVAYHDLDWANLYGIYQTLAVRICHGFKSINDEFLDLDMETVGEPVTVIERADERRDWTLQLHWAFRWTAYADPESGVIQPPFNVTRINSGLWRTWLPSDDFSQSVKDTELSAIVP